MKKINLFHYKFSQLKGFKNDTVKEFMDLISIVSSYETTSIDDIDKIKEIPKEYRDVIVEYYNKWIESENSEQIFTMSDEIEFNLIALAIFVFVVFVVWGFIYGGSATLWANFAILYTISVCAIESVLIGILASSAIGELLIDGTPLYDFLANFFLNNSQFGHEFTEHFFSSFICIVLVSTILGIHVGPLGIHFAAGLLSIPLDSIWISRLVFLKGGQSWFILPFIFNIIVGYIYYKISFK